MNNINPYTLSHRPKTYKYAKNFIKAINLRKLSISEDFIKNAIIRELYMNCLTQSLPFINHIEKCIIIKFDDELNQNNISDLLTASHDYTHYLCNLKTKEQFKEYLFSYDKSDMTIFLISKNLDGDCNGLLNALIDTDNEGDILNFFKKLANLFKQAYDVNFYHGDPKLQNIMFEVLENGDDYNMYFIDLEYSEFLGSPKNYLSSDFEYEEKNSVGTRYLIPKLAIDGIYNYNTNMYKGFDKFSPRYIRVKIIDLATCIMFVLLYYSGKLLDMPLIYQSLITYYTRFVSTSTQDANSKNKEDREDIYERVSPEFFIQLLNNT